MSNLAQLKPAQKGQPTTHGKFLALEFDCDEKNGWVHDPPVDVHGFCDEHRFDDRRAGVADSNSEGKRRGVDF